MPNEKWDYFTVVVKKEHPENTNDFLQKMGKEYWELVTVVERTYEELWVFKRIATKTFFDSFKESL